MLDARGSVRATASELEPVVVSAGGENDGAIRLFRLELHGVIVELCALGASITRILLPTAAGGADDVVLGYESVAEMYESQNPTFLGVTAGRVANRIGRGRFQTEPGGKVYQLETNDGTNHLHGGILGFSRRIWGVKKFRTDDGDEHVQFTLISNDGDQGYPGSVKVTATFSLQPTPSTHTVKLCLSMTAELLGDTPSPINLTQHSCFNLAGHDSANGILDHTLRLYCDTYTPVDASSIPTRQVQSLDDDPVMDWRSGRPLRQALTDFGRQKLGLSHEQVQTDLSQRAAALSISAPYGFDHNYIVRRASSYDDGLSLAVVLRHGLRQLTIRSTQPGVQLYTGNYMDGSLPVTLKKSEEAGQSYHRWQGLCLETQHFPDSILVDGNKHPSFADGQCPILTTESPLYEQAIEYTFENDLGAADSSLLTTEGFHGKDLDGNHFSSVEKMWEEQGVRAGFSTSWYERAAAYYEENCPPTIDGVLGGYASITEQDLDGSMQFMLDLASVRPSMRMWTAESRKPNGQRHRACECGAGLGRVAKGLLLRLNGIGVCDLVESSAALLAAAPDYLGDSSAARCRFFCVGLQDWQPAANTYAVVWVQWVLSYLTDDDIVDFLRRCGESLMDDGVIVLKENTCDDSDFEVDVEDASVTRSLRYWKRLIQQAGLRVFHEKMEIGLPDEIYPVPLLALEVWPRR